MENLENKILLDDICEQLNKRTSENAKKAYINQVIKITPHVIDVARDVVAKQIIDAAHFSFPEGIDITNISEDELKNIEKVPKINRSAQYVMSALMLVDLYTNIKIDFAKGAFQYDKLVESEIINHVLENVPESEINEFKMLIDYKYDEYYQKYFSMKAYVDSKLSNLESIIGMLTDIITTSIDKISKDKVIDVVDKVKEIKNK